MNDGGTRRRAQYAQRRSSKALILAIAALALACGDEPAPSPATRPSAGTNKDAGADKADSGPSDQGALDGSAKPSCDEAELSLGWPVRGERGLAWEVTNYFDLDPGTEIADYTGARGASAKTYDGHPGTDISIADFRAMDVGIEVTAVEGGTVVDVVDGFFDRVKQVEQPSCNAVQNYIAVVEPRTGYRHEYLHIRKGSAKVRIGDTVKRGDTLALVGSAGCSAGPHVHLNVIDCAQLAIDPFARGLFKDAPSYEAALRVMDTLLTSSVIRGSDDIADPRAQASTIVAGDALGIGLVLSAGRAGDALSLTLRRPDSSKFGSITSTLGALPRLTYTFWNVVPDASEGAWTLELSHAGASLGTRQIQVTRKAAPVQRLLLNVSANELDSVLSAQAALLFQPRIVDGYLDGAEARFNLVFEPGPVRELRAELSDTGMQTTRDGLAAMGLFPVQVDAYTNGGGTRYAAIFAAVPETFSYFGLSTADHNISYSAQLAAGRIPISIAIVGDAGTLRAAASYVANANLSFQSRQGISPSELDTHAASELAQRRFPSHMHATDKLPSQQHTLTWTSWDPGNHILVRDLTEAELFTRQASAQAAGLALVDLSATTTPDGVRYAALWLAQARTTW